MRKEQFVRIKGYEDYLVSNLGRVMSTRCSNSKILKEGKDRKGYANINIRDDKNIKKFFIHRLVLEAFKPNTEENIKVGRTDVNHINEIKSDNNLENLEWVTPKENNNHGTRAARAKITRKKNGKNGNSKPKKHYETKSTIISDFKRICKNQNWDFSEFEKVDSGEKTGNHKKYFFLRMEES